MQNIKERERHASPANRPQPLAFHESTLWMGSWDTDRLYAIDPKTWKVTDEVEAPGKPYGLASLGGELRVVVSIGEADDRFLYRFAPGKGFDAASKTPCPDDTGSSLATDGTTLYLGQMGLQRVAALDAHDKVTRTIALPTRCGGIGFGPGGFYIISADDEWENVKFAKLDITEDAPDLEPLASIEFDARALAYDGSAWWTSNREENEIVAFTV
jgi:sugar lactone lactonase YvrE